MEKFKVEIQETLARIIEIEASNIEDAISIVKEMYKKEEIVLDSGDYIDTEINEFLE